MSLHRPPLVCNRFEVMLVILLSLISSTRLIWLQIDARNPIVTDEFYGTSLAFNRSLAATCPNGVDPTFPYPSIPAEYTPSPTGAVSPGFEIILWVICQTERLRLESVMGYAPTAIGTSAFLTAITARLLTSTWVGGLAAASVVLSRGSILAGTHIAGTGFVVQALMCLFFCIMCLYARTRDARWLPFLSVIAVFAILMSPIQGPIFWLVYLSLLIRALNHARKTNFSIHRLRLHIITIVSTLVVLPLLIWSLRVIIPAATTSLSAFIKFLDITSILQFDLKSIAKLINLGVVELKRQDLHWHTSVALLAIAATWRRYLPRGSGFWALTILLITMAGLCVDGFLVINSATQIPEISTPLAYKMTGVIAAIEPLLIGTAVSYAWFALRSLLISIFPNYSSPPRGRDRIR